MANTEGTHHFETGPLRVPPPPLTVPVSLCSAVTEGSPGPMAKGKPGPLEGAEPSGEKRRLSVSVDCVLLFDFPYLVPSSAGFGGLFIPPVKTCPLRCTLTSVPCPKSESQDQLRAVMHPSQDRSTTKTGTLGAPA